MKNVRVAEVRALLNGYIEVTVDARISFFLPKKGMVLHARVKHIHESVGVVLEPAVNHFSVILSRQSLQGDGVHVEDGHARGPNWSIRTGDVVPVELIATRYQNGRYCAVAQLRTSGTWNPEYTLDTEIEEDNMNHNLDPEG